MSDLIETVGDTVGGLTKDKGGLLVLGVIGVMGYVIITKNNSSATVVTTPTGYTSYPSAEKNADVIIDSVNKNSDYNNTALLSALDALQQWQNEQFTGVNEKTADQIADLKDHTDSQFQGVKDKMDQQFGSISGQYENLSDQYGTISEQYKNLSGQVTNVGKKVDTVSGQVTNVGKQVTTNTTTLQNLLNQILSLVTPRATTPVYSSSSSGDDDRDAGVPEGYHGHVGSNKNYTPEFYNAGNYRG